MKKVLFVVLFVVLIPKVNALEYKFIELTDKCTNTDVIKCEEVKYNKFYKEEIASFTYEEESFISEEYPYIDKNDTKVLIENTINETGSVENNAYRINFGYEVDSVSFENINIDNSNLIKIYYDNNLISDYDIIQKNNYLEFNFNKVLDPRLLSISVDTSIIKDFYIRLKLNNSYIHEANINVNESITLAKILFKDTDKYYELLNELNVSYNNNKFRVKYYEENKTLYKFYNTIKTYYKDLDVDYLEGYKYDENESYIMYKKYELVKEDVNLEKNVNILKPKSIYYGKPIFHKINPIPIDHQTKVFKSKTKYKRFNLGKPNIYYKLSNKDKTDVKKNYILYPLVLICIISLRFLYVKFKYNNAT